MTRTEAFHNFKNHSLLRKDYERLSDANKATCLEFIAKFDHLDKPSFAAKAQMWMVGAPEKPAQHSLMWSLVFMANGSHQ